MSSHLSFTSLTYPSALSNLSIPFSVFFISVIVFLSSDIFLRFLGLEILFVFIYSSHKFIEYLYDHYFEIYPVDCSCPFCFILFLSFYLFLLFGTFPSVSSFCSTCLNILDKSVASPHLEGVALCRVSLGPDSTNSPGHSSQFPRGLMCVVFVHPSTWLGHNWYRLDSMQGCPQHYSL